VGVVGAQLHAAPRLTGAAVGGDALQVEGELRRSALAPRDVEAVEDHVGLELVLHGGIALSLEAQ
jgi:hypothetical protein